MAVMLMSASASLVKTGTSAPVRSVPSTRKAFFRGLSLSFALRAKEVNARASSGTKSTWTRLRRGEGVHRQQADARVLEKLGEGGALSRFVRSVDVVVGYFPNWSRPLPVS